MRENVSGVTSARWPTSLTHKVPCGAGVGVHLPFGASHLPGHSLSMPPAGCPRPQVLAVSVRQHFHACYFLSLTSPLLFFFLKKEENVLFPPLQKHDGNPHVSVPWPFWERSVQLPVYAGPAACLWSGSQGHPHKTWGCPSTYVKRSWKEDLCLHNHRPQGNTRPAQMSTLGEGPDGADGVPVTQDI